MKSISVFCASRLGKDLIYAQVASEVGRLLAKNGYQIIYGGGKVGLMGKVADAAIGAGGKVIGVIPRFLDKLEVAHQGLDQLILVESMHERKLKMLELSDIVLTLPGGFGTLEELTEMLTWSQLDLHQKPIGILNVNGYYDNMEKLFDSMLEKDFLKEDNRRLAIFDKSIERLLARLENHPVSQSQHSLDKDKT